MERDPGVFLLHYIMRGLELFAAENRQKLFKVSLTTDALLQSAFEHIEAQSTSVLIGCNSAGIMHQKYSTGTGSPAFLLMFMLTKIVAAGEGSQSMQSSK